MSIHYSAEAFEVINVTRTKAPFATRVERSFEVPLGLHVATIGLYFAFLAIMALAFHSEGMGLVIGICVVYVAMAFGTPAMWLRMKPDHESKAMPWPDFARRGIDTYTGRMSAKDATGQILILPVLITFWAFGIALLAAILG